MPFDSFGTFVLLVLEADFITQQKNVGHFCHGGWLAGVARMDVFVAFFLFLLSYPIPLSFDKKSGC